MSCALYQRSGDVGLGVPFNIASYSFLLHLIAHHCNLIPCDFVYFLGNAHIYDDHMEPLLKQVENELYDFPKLTIKNRYENIEQYTLEDFQLDTYKHNDSISMKMRV